MLGIQIWLRHKHVWSCMIERLAGFNGPVCPLCRFGLRQSLMFFTYRISKVDINFKKSWIPSNSITQDCLTSQLVLETKTLPLTERAAVSKQHAQVVSNLIFIKCQLKNKFISDVPDLNQWYYCHIIQSSGASKTVEGTNWEARASALRKGDSCWWTQNRQSFWTVL